jgi:formylglycine-generating enzyme required for sulfatase activity
MRINPILLVATLLTLACTPLVQTRPGKADRAIDQVKASRSTPHQPSSITLPHNLGEATMRLGKASFSMVLVPTGSYRMGSTAGEVDEQPVHEVRITKAFWIGKYEVTQGQWRAVMGGNPSGFQGDLQRPLENVTWDDAQEFISRLNQRQSEWSFRLPTEAEWEYACRAGTDGDTYGPVDDVAWYGGNSERTTHPVGQKQPNAFGTYDMLGNVWEWCQDYYGPYEAAPQVDPTGASSGAVRVCRGGCWRGPVGSRSPRRLGYGPGHRDINLGLRLVGVQL